MIFDVATLYNMYQNGNLDVQASQLVLEPYLWDLSDITAKSSRFDSIFKLPKPVKSIGGGIANYLL